MGSYNFGNDVIAAFEAGRKAKQAREQQALIEEDRKLKLDLLKDEQTRIKRQQQIEKYQLMRGTQGQTLPGVPSQQGSPATFQGMNVPGSGAIPTPAIPPAELPHAPVEIEPGFSLRPENRSEAQAMGLQDMLNKMAIESRAKQNEPFTLGEGQKRFVGGAEIASGPPKVDKPSSSVQEYLYYVQEETKAGRAPLPFNEYQTMDANRKANRTTVINQPDKWLTPQEAAQLGVPYGTTREEARGQTPFKDSQGATANYATRIEQANKVFDEIEQEVSRKGFLGALYQEKAPNVLQSQTGQMFAQAKRNFINAVLRRESGAVISPSEFTDAEKQYFPKPGDSSEVLAQKKENRQLVQRNFINESGNAYQPTVGATKVNSDGDTVTFDGTKWVLK